MFLITLYCDQEEREFFPLTRFPFPFQEHKSTESQKALPFFSYQTGENSTVCPVKMKTARGVRFQPELSGTCLAPPTHCSLSVATLTAALKKWQAPLRNLPEVQVPGE